MRVNPGRDYLPVYCPPRHLFGTGDFRARDRGPGRHNSPIGAGVGYAVALSPALEGDGALRAHDGADLAT